MDTIIDMKELHRMKGIKIAFPIVGIFLVIYIAMVFMNSAKMNGLVAQINKEYNDDFTIVYSDMGNVFTDNDYLFSVRSNQTGIIYELENANSTVTGSYYVENVNNEINKLIETVVDDSSYAFASIQPIEINEATALEAINVTSLNVKVLTDEVTTKNTMPSVRAAMQEAFPTAAITLELFEVNEQVMKEVRANILSVKQRSLVTEDDLSPYKFEKSKY